MRDLGDDGPQADPETWDAYQTNPVTYSREAAAPHRSGHGEDVGVTIGWISGSSVLSSSVRAGLHVVGHARTARRARMSGKDLIDRCRAGERDAQRELFERTSTRIYRLLLRMTGDPDDAADLTQETYVKGFQGLDRFDGQSATISTWLYRIAVNEALQFRRRQGVATLKLLALAPNQPTEAQRPRTDVQLDMEEALAELPSDDRALLLLRYQEELDYRDIAEVLECAEGTVASRLNRARERLREILRKSYG